MAATGDISHLNSKPLGDNLFESTVTGQEGARLIIIDEQDLPRFFPYPSLQTGIFEFHFATTHSRHLIAIYQRE
jgi:hypothetical protein